MMPITKPTLALAGPLYMAPATYYAAMAACGRVVYDTRARYDKRRKEVHRATIADTHGELRLTVPVGGRGDDQPGTRPLWAHRRVSAHGRWWEVHRIALESAYGRTPYFQFYIDRLLPMLSPDSVGRSIIDLDMDIDRAIRSMLHLPVEVLTPDQLAAGEEPGLTLDDLEVPPAPPYWQVRAAEHGFIRGLSVLDMIFNIGPESQLLISDMASKTTIRKQ